MVREYGYEYDAALDTAVWAKTRGSVTSKKLWDAYCLRSGRDALKAIAREYPPGVVLLPALACNSMVHPFELYGHEIKYYRLNDRYEIDLDNLEGLIVREKPILFLYMNYFGNPAIRDETLEGFRARSNIIFIEDRTHDLLSERSSSFRSDYVMASLRKWIPVPDGGLLWGKISKPLGADTSFSTTRLKAQRMRHEFLRCGDESIKVEFRKLFSTVSDIMEDDEPSAMTSYSYELAIKTDWDRIKKSRRDNAETIINALSASPFVAFIQKTVGLSDLYVPFLVPNRDEVQRRLSAQGIFNTIIWPITDKQKQACGIAGFTEEHMLAAPCDQRYTKEDMKYIGAEIVRVIADVNR